MKLVNPWWDSCALILAPCVSISGGNVLLVAHKGSVDVCTRQLVGGKPRARPAFRQLVSQVPFCAFGCIEEPSCGAAKWEMVEPPIQTFTHKGSSKYNWSIWKWYEGTVYMFVPSASKEWDKRWWPLLGLLSWCPLILVKSLHSFEDQEPVGKFTGT